MSVVRDALARVHGIPAEQVRCDNCNIVGCYIDRHYIEQTDERYMKHLEECVERFKAEEAKGEYDWLKEKKEKKHELGMDTHILCE